MADAFLSMVSKSAKFDKKRFADDFSLFSEKTSKAAVQRADADAAPQERKSERSQREINALRTQHRVKVYGEDVPNPVFSFKEMVEQCKVPPGCIHNVTSQDGLGFTKPTAVQMQAVPIISKRRDIMAGAPTGSGKTLAYILPILARLKKPAEAGIRALILAPSRELAAQIYRYVCALTVLPKQTQTRDGPKIPREKKDGARQSKDKSKRELRLWRVFLLSAKNASLNVFGKAGGRKRDILVSTPLVLMHLLKAGEGRSDGLDLSNVRVLILDEADRLIDLHQQQAGVQKARRASGTANAQDEPDKSGSSKRDKKASKKGKSPDKDATTQVSEKKRRDGRFRPSGPMSFLEQVDYIMSFCTHKKLVRGLFTATLGQSVEELARNFLRNPIRLTIGRRNAACANVTQKLRFVSTEGGKLPELRRLLKSGGEDGAGLQPPILVFVQSRNRAGQLCGELKASGFRAAYMSSDLTLDQRLNLVEQFRLGNIWILICTDLMARGIDFHAVKSVINFDMPVSATEYIHRVGRTGRAGRTGSALTFFTEEDRMMLPLIAQIIKTSGGDVPEWMLKLKKPGSKERRKWLQSPPQREAISKTVFEPEKRPKKRRRSRKKQSSGIKKLKSR